MTRSRHDYIIVNPSVGYDLGRLKPGQLTLLKDPHGNPDMWVIRCPVCRELGSLSCHKVSVERGSVTISPSLVCTTKGCTAHYVVQKGRTYIYEFQPKALRDLHHLVTKPDKEKEDKTFWFGASVGLASWLTDLYPEGYAN